MRVVISVLLLLCSSLARAETFADQYPGPWRDDLKIELVKLLVANKARGCGEFWWRTRNGETGPYAEYLVYCTRDGKRWTAWLLWPGSGRAQGPSEIADGLPPPNSN